VFGEGKFWVATQRTFEAITKKPCLAPILALSNFRLLFQVKCDASGVIVREFSPKPSSP